MIEKLKTEVVKSRYVSDKSAIDMVIRVVNNRFPNVFNTLIERDIRNGYLHVAPDVERKLKGMVVVNNNDLHYNMAGLITDVKNPLEGLTKVKEMYAIFLKGTVLKKIVNDSKVRHGKVIRETAKMYVSIVSDIIQGKEKDTFMYPENKVQMEIILFNFFFSGMVGYENRTGKNMTTSILKEMYSTEFDVGEIENYEFVSMDFTQMCETISGEFEMNMHPRIIHGAFLKNFNFAYLGLENLNEFVAGIYALAKTASYNGKYITKRYPYLADSFISSVERGI